LTVAGYGREESRLRALAVDGVRFVGKMEPSLMPALYASADIFVNASVVDNQPVSILEAMASGLSVVSTPTGDIPALVQHRESGLLVSPDSPASLAAAVLQLLAEPDAAQRMAQHARDHVARHAWPAVRNQWAAVYAGRASAVPTTETNDTQPWTASHTTH
jgi:L-malate glycosyltransferase